MNSVYRDDNLEEGSLNDFDGWWKKFQSFVDYNWLFKFLLAVQRDSLLLELFYSGRNDEIPII